MQAQEDYCGLWEILWALDGRTSDESGRTEAERAVRELRQRGWIQLFRGNYALDPVAPILDEELGAILADDRSWKPPANRTEPSIIFTATPEGDRVSLQALDLNN